MSETDDANRPKQQDAPVDGGLLEPREAARETATGVANVEASDGKSASALGDDGPGGLLPAPSVTDKPVSAEVEEARRLQESGKRAIDALDDSKFSVAIINATNALSGLASLLERFVGERDEALNGIDRLKTALYVAREWVKAEARDCGCSDRILRHLDGKGGGE